MVMWVRRKQLISLVLVTSDYNKTPMVMGVQLEAGHAATHEGKKYPSPPAPDANIPPYRGRGVPVSEE